MRMRLMEPYTSISPASSLPSATPEKSRAEDQGELTGDHILEVAGADLPVDRVDAGGVDADENLAVGGDGVGDLVDVEAVGGAVGVEMGGAHGECRHV